jgi:hypothetical protein
MENSGVLRAAPLLALISTLGLVACGGGVAVNSDYDPGADFASYQSYAWAERSESGDDDPRVYNAITMQRVRTAVDRALAAKGYSEATGGAPDFYVAWHGAIEGKMSYQTINSHYGYGWGWYGGMGVGTSSTYVNEWDEGTLLVDIIDAGRNELVWRGTATGTVEPELTPAESQARLDDAAAKLLQTFPPDVTGG